MLRFSAFAGLILLAVSGPLVGQTVVTFENPTLTQPLTAPDTFQNGATLNPPGGFTTSGVTFNNSYDTSFGTWSGWAYSNVTNVTTAGFGNQYAAYHVPTGGSGDGSANYAVVNNFSVGDASVTWQGGLRPESVRVTNTTYAALSMQTGDQFAKKFGGPTGNDPDFFKLTVHGRNAQDQPTGSVDFFLADYRFADNSKDYVVNKWTTVDLTPLGADTTKLLFELASSDVGQFGMNTPSYFAADNLTLTPVPEPGLVGLVAAGGFGAWRLVRRRKGG